MLLNDASNFEFPLPILLGVIVLHLTQLISIIKNYIWHNIGAPFVVGFQASLIIFAGLLITGNSVLADSVATVAYFFLVFGVVFQLISYFLEQRKKV